MRNIILVTQAGAIFYLQERSYKHGDGRSSILGNQFSFMVVWTSPGNGRKTSELRKNGRKLQ